MTSDPRPLLAQSVVQSERLVAATRADQLGDPTPCTEFDVRALLGHILCVLRRIALVGRGGDALDVPQVVTDIDDWADEVAKTRRDIKAVWATDTLLNTEFAVPWAASTPGRYALRVWTLEQIMHSWDLAEATNRIGELDPELGEVGLDIAHSYIPAEPRGGPVPFEPVVQVPPDAAVYTQLAGYLGRQV